ncbi:MAG: glycogen/starch synthase [Deltaproteobacteria bacterium]|nr:glycogen/starch synthase [Deltaproteobacteria bacterium]
MAITICVNEFNPSKQENTAKVIEKDIHVNTNLLKAMYEDSPLVDSITEKKIVKIIVDKVIEGENELESNISALTRKRVKPVKALPALREAFRFEDHGHVNVSGSDAIYYINFFIDKDIFSKTELIVRWGSYDDIPENWEDLSITADDIVTIEEGHYYVKKSLPPLRRGWYGATCYARDTRDGKEIWQGNGFTHDAKFRINEDSRELFERTHVVREKHFFDATQLIVRQIHNYRQLESQVHEMYLNGPKRDLSRILFEATKDNEKLCESLGRVYDEALKRQSASVAGSKEAERANVLAAAINNIGVGEVVLVSPEGPQATFGGIAQVMEGFLNAFSASQIPVTFIGPLYEQNQGNKHADAQTTLRRGVMINGELVRPKYAGEIEIPFGPTHRANTTQWAQQPHSVRANIYIAERGLIRVVLIRHCRYADRLYPRLLGDEQLRRAIFLCRGALEVMKNPTYGIKPQLILSNDWIGALIPVFLKLDQRYSENDQLRGCKTIHLIHNCGRDYHGRFPNHHDNQSLFPMLELNPIHYEGLMDPNQKNFFNMTAAAIHHLNGAVIAVSKPYAQQLLSNEGSDGLSHLIWKQRDALFGISNGVDQRDLRRVVTRIGKGALRDLGRTVTAGSSEDAAHYFEQLLSYKNAAKIRMQKNFGLHQDGNKIVLSLVGRLVEQKGIQLLMGNAAGDNCSVMEYMLRRFGDTQIIVAGPRVDGDNMSEHFCGMVDHLRRCFPGRVVGIFDFMPHDFAMEVFTASDFALMPSRFEPGGLTQLEALAAGNLVIARNVGGISATLNRFNDQTGKGNGFLFDDYSSTALRNTICWAIERTRSTDFRRSLMLEAAHAEHDWSHRIPRYLAVFQHIAGVLSDGSKYPFLRGRVDVVNNTRA